MLNTTKILDGFTGDYADEMKEIISYGFTDGSLSDFITYLQDDINDNGAIDELIDRNIDIYYYDLRQWSVDNYDYIDNYIEEFGTTEIDFHKLIQGGQYMYYSGKINDELSDMVDFIENKYNI